MKDPLFRNKASISPTRNDVFHGPMLSPSLEVNPMEIRVPVWPRTLFSEVPLVMLGSLSPRNMQDMEGGSFLTATDGEILLQAFGAKVRIDVVQCPKFS